MENSIECTALIKDYGKKRAVAGIDLQVEKGTCFGLLGPNGAGKTTTVEMLEGLHPPTSGSLRIFGLSYADGQGVQIRERVGVQLQDTQLADKLTVREVITLFRSFYKKGKDVDTLLKMVRLEKESHQRFHTLSGGQKQRVALATALAGEPELLFLDEPTTGLDPRARQSLWTVVEEFRDAGGTVVLTTHYMDEAAHLCDKIAVMDLGKIITQGTPRQLIDSLGDVQFVEFEDAQQDVNLSQQSMIEKYLAHPAIERAELHRGKTRLTIPRDLHSLSEILKFLEGQKVEPVGLSTHQATLDDVFLHLTGKELADA